MRWSGIIVLVKWPLTLAVLGCLLGLGYLVHREAREERAEEARRERGDDEDDKVRQPAESIIKLRADQVASLDLKDASARLVQWQPHTVVFGRVVPNPRATGEARAAHAGTLRPAGGPWPALGDTVRAGQVLGWLDVRVGPQERLDLQSKLREAQLKELGAEDVLKIQQDRAARLEVAGGGVSRAELDAARVQVAEARTHLAVAKAAVKAWEDALRAIDGQGDRKDSTWSQPLAAPLAGEVTEVAARPGMAMQAGDLVARVVDFRKALIRVDLPAHALAGGPPPALELFTAADAPIGEEGMLAPAPRAAQARPVRAVAMGPAPQVDPASQRAGYWYEASAAARGDGKDGAQPPAGTWRPGLFVKAYLPVPGTKPEPAVAVPATALLYHEGQTVVFVRTRPDTFERRAVRALGREGDRWILGDGVRPGERVVTHRAQVLLSQALLAGQPGGAKDDD
jgi:hypothetical protein